MLESNRHASHLPGPGPGPRWPGPGVEPEKRFHVVSGAVARVLLWRCGMMSSLSPLQSLHPLHPLEHPATLTSTDRLQVLRFAASFLWADSEVADAERT